MKFPANFFKQKNPVSEVLYYYNSISNCVSDLNCFNRDTTSVFSKVSIRSVPNFSTQKEAKLDP